MGGKLLVDADARGIVPLLPLDGLRNALAPSPGETPTPAASAAGGVR
jgi:hypothetical protein